MKTQLLGLAALLLTGLPLWAQPDTTTKAPFVAVPRRTLDEILKDAGGPTLLTFDFQNTPFEEAIAEVARQSDVKIAVASDLEGKAKTPVTAKADKMPFWEALAPMLAPRGLWLSEKWQNGVPILTVGAKEWMGEGTSYGQLAMSGPICAWIQSVTSVRKKQLNGAEPEAGDESKTQFVMLLGFDPKLRLQFSQISQVAVTFLDQDRKPQKMRVSLDSNADSWPMQFVQFSLPLPPEIRAVSQVRFELPILVLRDDFLWKVDATKPIVPGTQNKADRRVMQITRGELKEARYELQIQAQRPHFPPVFQSGRDSDIALFDSQGRLWRRTRWGYSLAHEYQTGEFTFEPPLNVESPALLVWRLWDDAEITDTTFDLKNIELP